MNKDKHALTPPLTPPPIPAHTPPLDPNAGMSPADAGAPLVERNPAAEAATDDQMADYTLTVPEDLADIGIQPDMDHPLYKSAAAWARERQLSQHDFDELAAGFYRSLAEDAQRDQEAEQAERKSFIDAFAPVAMQGRDDDAALEAARRNARPVVDWAAGLLAPAIRQNPDLGQMLEEVFSFADGVALMRAVKSAIGEKTPGPQPTPSGMPAPRSAEEVLYGATTPARGL